MPKAKLVFSHTDNGFCRCYYKVNKTYVCLQLDHGKEYMQFVCTPELEPDYELDLPWHAFPMPPLEDQSSTAVEVREWLKSKEVENV